MQAKPSFNIAIVGTGQVATHLALVLAQVGHRIVQIFARDLLKAEQLAMQVNAQAIVNVQDFSTDIDICIIAVSDSAIESIIKQVGQYVPNALVVHTSGSTDINILAKYRANVGVFYPLQTFSLERVIDWLNVPLLLETDTLDNMSKLEHLAQSLSKRIYKYSSQQRQVLHLSAVMACNFSNLCYDLAYQVMAKQEVDYQLLAPLMMETTEKAIHFQPNQVQTGPAKRQDFNILAQHQQLLSDLGFQQWQSFYQQMSDLIMQQHKK